MTTGQARRFGIYGSGGFAREVAWLIEQCYGDDAVTAYIDDDESKSRREVLGIPVVHFDEFRERRLADAIVVAVGNSRTRERLAGRVTASGFQMPAVIHPRVEHSRWIEIGEGSVICAGSILTTNIRLGRGVQINLDCTVGHDVVLENFVTLAPGVHVSGCVTVGARAYIGTGAAIINGQPGAPLIIGPDSVIGAGACVTKNVPADATVVGVPARPRS